MKVFKTVHVKAHDKQELDKTLCDFCGEETGAEGVFAVDEVRITRSKGTSYPEGDFLDKTNIDMCGSCFNDMLLPFLRSKAKNTDWVRES